MENKHSFISRLDENVIVTMLAVSIIACVILAFRNKSREPCVPFTISTLNDHYYVGDNIAFETNAPGFKKLTWEFGDKHMDKTNVKSAFHIYDEPGPYVVTVLTDNGCTAIKMLTIDQKKVIVNARLAIPRIECPDTVEVGQTVQFKSSITNASTYEWSFGESKTIDATSPNPTYSYNKDGYKKVSLKINDNDEQYNDYNIFVKPKFIPKQSTNNNETYPARIEIARDPISPKLEPKDDNIVPPPQKIVDNKREFISPEDLKKRFYLVADKKLNDKDFIPYLAWGNLNMPVELVEESKISNITFARFCQILSDLRNSRKIKTFNIIELEKNENNGIERLKIEFKAKGR